MRIRLHNISLLAKKNYPLEGCTLTSHVSPFPGKSEKVASETRRVSEIPGFPSWAFS
jgi:hypothetical protein